MKILLHPKYHHPKIEIIETMGGLTGREVTLLEEFLYACLDKGKYYVLIDFGLVKIIDGRGTAVLEYFVNRHMHLRLFNIRPGIQGMLRMLGKEGFVKTYNEIDSDVAVFLFEKEISENKHTAKSSARGRRHTRVNTFFPNEFKHHSNHSEEIEGKANVLNISEAGLFANQIIAFNLKTGKIVNAPDLAERELHAIKFSLNGSLKLIETKGRCIWQKRKGKDLCIGIRFNGMSKVHKDMIRNYIYESIQSKDKP